MFTKHLGNSSNEDNLGAWRKLSSLDISPEKSGSMITIKHHSDYNLTHEAGR
ncbi:hypothetical protein PCANC_05965 [Puccinia coronata f. sp. avenae]|uniref:Uncharacterized protein n=1 Tax=Puccinia coronata f. sp. avenae TaxID=200324 RepID=A0A2N5VTX6_9BASI|nr:hypothetical protein PCANC_05965 [Puccinia coronata f. sp. avenae]